MRYFAPLLAALLPLAGCGYHVAGKADLLPKTVKTIAIPSFGNVTVRYKLAESLPKDITREFLERTRYRIVANPNEADAILTGAVVNFFSYPTVFDPNSGRASGVQAVVVLQLRMIDRSTGAVIFSRPNMEFRERYEISIDPKVYFDESDAAMQRLSGDVARSVVSAILENF